MMTSLVAAATNENVVTPAPVVWSRLAINAYNSLRLANFMFAVRLRAREQNLGNEQDVSSPVFKRCVNAELQVFGQTWNDDTRGIADDEKRRLAISLIHTMLVSEAPTMPELTLPQIRFWRGIELALAQRFATLGLGEDAKVLTNYPEELTRLAMKRLVLQASENNFPYLVSLSYFIDPLSLRDPEVQAKLHAIAENSSNCGFVAHEELSTHAANFPWSELYVPVVSEFAGSKIARHLRIAAREGKSVMLSSVAKATLETQLLDAVNGLQLLQAVNALEGLRLDFGFEFSKSNICEGVTTALYKHAAEGDPTRVPGAYQLLRRIVRRTLGSDFLTSERYVTALTVGLDNLLERNASMDAIREQLSCFAEKDRRALARRSGFCERISNKIKSAIADWVESPLEYLNSTIQTAAREELHYSIEFTVKEFNLDRALLDFARLTFGKPITKATTWSISLPNGGMEFVKLEPCFARVELADIARIEAQCKGLMFEKTRIERAQRFLAAALLREDAADYDRVLARAYKNYAIVTRKHELSTGPAAGELSSAYLEHQALSIASRLLSEPLSE